MCPDEAVELVHLMLGRSDFIEGDLHLADMLNGLPTLDRCCHENVGI